jgi:2,4-dienoyl-CoA reductase-like NADH-dependent reductase (Old Yellow Enzyme family)
LTKEGIKKVIEDWISTAKRAITAGFDVIEIHGAHGPWVFSARIHEPGEQQAD